MYVQDLVATVTRPVKELKGFIKVDLSPGDEVTAQFTLPAGTLCFLNRDLDYVVEPGEFSVMVGRNSRDIELEETIKLTGEETVFDEIPLVYPSAIE